MIVISKKKITVRNIFDLWLHSSIFKLDINII